MMTPYTPAYQAPTQTGIVLVGGCFDVLHYGHVRFLEQARALGTYLIIALEQDAVIEGTKHRTPFHTQTQRATILDALTCVDEVLLLPRLSTFEDYLTLVKICHPSIIAYTEGDALATLKDQQAASIGAQAISIPFEEGFSTTALLDKYRQ